MKSNNYFRYYITNNNTICYNIIVDMNLNFGDNILTVYEEIKGNLS